MRTTAPRVILGVGGGIAAYKACELLRRLREAECDVTVVPTEAALKFVGAPTWEALSGKPVSASVWDRVHDVPHVSLGKSADIVVVAPTTANVLAKAANGIADDLLTNILLTASCPVLLAPAMHTEMWLHPATQANVATLRARGVHVLEPDNGRLTGADSGPGRLPEPTAIAQVALGLLSGNHSTDLAGMSVLVSAGGTREALDPVRYLGNRSSGKQGIALAQRAQQRGAKVTLVAANLDAMPLQGIDVVNVESAAQMASAIYDRALGMDAIVMAAAVADYRPDVAAESKLKKSGEEALELTLVQNEDILATLVRERQSRTQVIVGFAAETGDEQGSVLDHGRDKLARKGCDLLVVNDVSAGNVFGRDENEVVILSTSGDELPVARASKAQIADAVWDAVAKFRATTR
mgnify:CR=1 FL=1